MKETKSSAPRKGTMGRGGGSGKPARKGTMGQRKKGS